MRRSIEERFWAKVDKDGPIHPTCGQCWIWTAARYDGDRGHFYVGEGRHESAHSFSLELKLGRRIAQGMNALHTCDNPLCVNPDHLWEGTQQENIQDMMSKGRGKCQYVPSGLSVAGENNVKAKITEDTVRWIRRAAATGMMQKEIGKVVGLTQGVVSKIVRRTLWKHVV